MRSRTGDPRIEKEKRKQKCYICRTNYLSVFETEFTAARLAAVLLPVVDQIERLVSLLNMDPLETSGNMIDPYTRTTRKCYSHASSTASFQPF